MAKSQKILTLEYEKKNPKQTFESIKTTEEVFLKMYLLMQNMGKQLCQVISQEYVEAGIGNVRKYELIETCPKCAWYQRTERHVFSYVTYQTISTWKLIIDLET